MEKVYMSVKWWDVKDWRESLSGLKEQLHVNVHRTFTWEFYLLYMLYSNLSRVLLASFKLSFV